MRQSKYSSLTPRTCATACRGSRLSLKGTRRFGREPLAGPGSPPRSRRARPAGPPGDGTGPCRGNQGGRRVRGDRAPIAPRPAYGRGADEGGELRARARSRSRVTPGERAVLRDPAEGNTDGAHRGSEHPVARALADVHVPAGEVRARPAAPRLRPDAEPPPCRAGGLPRQDGGPGH